MMEMTTPDHTPAVSVLAVLALRGTIGLVGCYSWFPGVPGWYSYIIGWRIRLGGAEGRNKNYYFIMIILCL
jgi:hypothetical protein